MSDLDDIRSRLDRLTWELLDHISESFMLGHTVCPEDDEFILVRKYLQLVEDIQGRRQRSPVFGRFSASDLKDSESYVAALMQNKKQDKSGLDYLHKLNLQPKDIIQSELYPENKTFEFIKWERENDVQGLFYVWDLDENNEHYKTGAKVLIPNNSFGKVVAKPVKQGYEKLSNLDLQPGDLIESKLYPETVFLEFIKKIDDMTGYFKFVTKDEKYFKRLSGEMINLGLFTFGKVVKRAKQDKI